jgi:hypothetical protein
MSDQLQGGGRTDIVFQMEPQDLVHAQKLHFRFNLKSRAGVVRLALLWLLAVAAFAALLNGLGSETFAPTVIFAFVSPIAIVGIPFLIVQTMSGRAARKVLGQQKTLQKPIQLSWTDDGVVFESDFGDARMKWTDFFTTRQDRHIIMLYESPRLYRMIPKRVLTDAQRRDLASIMGNISKA